MFILRVWGKGAVSQLATNAAEFAANSAAKKYILPRPVRSIEITIVFAISPRDGFCSSSLLE